VRLGVCYYPEHWPQDRWPVDAALMADTGLDLVRIGEFSWAVSEPSRNRWSWDWLDRAIDVLAGAGLDVVLGTPTATPPVWLAVERPEIISVGPDGRRRAYGSRRHTCPTSAAYREESARVVTALAQRYGRHEAVVAWQVDNEPGNHDSARCWCGECAAAFAEWLAERYGTVDELNEAWGTVFWSQIYPSFEAVVLPVPTRTDHNPSLLLAHRRFSSAQAASGLAEQRAILAEASHGRDVTTNLYLGDLHVDAREVHAPTGLAAVDSYPHDTSGPLETAFVLDLARSTSGRQRAWVMEQQPGEINWSARNPMVPPGQVLTWGRQAALRGIEALLFFRWRAGRGGQEQEHAGLLRHDASPDRGLAEARELASWLRSIDPALLERDRAPVALTFAYDDAWVLEIDPHRAGLRHRDFVVPAYRAARRLGLDVDVVDPTEDLTGYEIVLAPALHLRTPERVSALLAAVDSGATVVVGPRALVRDADAVWVDEPLPGGLAGRLGTRVTDALAHETWPAGPPPVTVDGAPAGPWLDVLAEPAAGTGAEVLSRWGGGTWLDGLPAVVRTGGLVYCGPSSDEAWTALLARLSGRQPLPEHLERVERAGRVVELDHATFSATVH
jgi:beta-galactosidase